MLAIEESILVTELNKIILKSRKKSAPGIPTEPPPMPYWIEERIADPGTVDLLDVSQALQERENMRSLVRYGLKKIDEGVFLYQYLFDELEDVQFETPVYKEIYSMFQQGISDKGNELDPSYFLENGSEAVKKEVIDLITDRHEISANWESKYKIFVPREEEILDRKVYTDMLRLKMTNLKKMIKKNLADLRTASSDREQEKFQKIHVELKKAEKQIADVLGIIISN